MHKIQPGLHHSLIAIALLFATATSSLALGRANAVKLDLMNPPRQFDYQLKDHVIGIRKKIQSCWLPPTRQVPNPVKVQILILQDGQLEDAKVTQSSGDRNFDQQALNAIFASSPFPAWHQQNLNIEADFDAKYFTAEQYQENKYRIEQAAARRSQRQIASQPTSAQWSSTENSHQANEPASDASADSISSSAWLPSDGDATSLKEIVVETQESGPNGRVFSKPLLCNQFKNITPDQQSDYLQWFKQWLALPSEQKFAFLKPNPATSSIPSRTRR